MKFLIRDDDLNYFSKPADIERWYTDIFDQGIPVGFSAIPFVTPASDVYTADTPPSEEECPIGANTELTSYVKQHPLIEILQHGTTHATVNSIYEYQNPHITLTEAARGRMELERAFGSPIGIFVPPHDWIGGSGILSVEAAGMDIIRGRGAGLRNFIPRFAYFVVFIKAVWHKLSHLGKEKTPAYPYVLDFGKHKEVCSYRLEDTDVFDGMEYAHRKKGIFVVVTHLHFFNEEKKARLLQVIKRANELNAEFVPPSALFG
ncbi:MAG: hypothetical protein JWO84_751 [Parcubacteria group bacterium]|nr:hypothetical protein [Parcubacteria group bacterium]